MRRSGWIGFHRKNHTPKLASFSTVSTQTGPWRRVWLRGLMVFEFQIHITRSGMTALKT